MRIGICSLYIGDNFKHITRYTLQNKLEYANKHHYDFIIDESVLDTTRPIAWSKILLVKKYLPYYDYIVWMDADLYIMNYEYTLEYFIERFQNGKDVLVGTDWQKLNTGVFFMKNTAFSMQFLDKVYALNDIGGGDYEQDAILHLTNNNIDGCMDHFSIVYQTHFNSYWYNFHPDQFILHMAGCRKLSDLKLMLDKFCPVKREDDTEEIYQQRLKWIREESCKESAEILKIQKNDRLASPFGVGL